MTNGSARVVRSDRKMRFSPETFGGKQSSNNGTRVLA